MTVHVEYTRSEAEHLSPKGSIISLYALGLQGYDFTANAKIPIRGLLRFQVYTGLKIHWDDPTIVGYLASVVNPTFPSLKVVNTGFITRNDPCREIGITMVSEGNELCLLDYGVKVAELVFLRLATME